MKICLDPGHGQFNNPGYAPGYFEGTQMFKFAYKLKAELERYSGVEALVVTRKVVSDNPGLWDRGLMAKDFDLFLSLHSNAPGSIKLTAVHGVSIYDSFEKPNQPLAEALGAAIARTMDSYVRGIEHRESTTHPGQDWYGVLRSAIRNNCRSALLLEHGFHTNPDESAWLMIDSNLELLAEAEAEVIAIAYGLIDVEDEEMYCKRGDGQETPTSSNPRVKAVQAALLALGYKLTNPKTGVDTTADGRYGPGCAAGVDAFKRNHQLPGIGDTFEVDCVTTLIGRLLQRMADMTIKFNAQETELREIRLIIAQLIPYAT